MNRAILRLVMILILMGLCSCCSVAGIIFNDQFEGSNSGISSSVKYVDGLNGLGINLSGGHDFVCYDRSVFPTNGMFSFSAKIYNFNFSEIFTTVGTEGAIDGDMAVDMMPSGSLLFQVFHTGQWNVLSSTRSLSKDKWFNVALSYGSEGMKLYINGNLDNTLTSCTIGRVYKNMYVGDYQLDGSYALAFVGSLDNLKVSNIQSDPALLMAPASAVPEPGSMLALMTGLISSAAIYRRKRS